MGSHRPKNSRHPRRRTGGRHTSLIGGTDYDTGTGYDTGIGYESGLIGAGPGRGDPFVSDPVFGDSGTSLIAGTGYESGFGDDGLAYGGSRTSLVGGYAPEPSADAAAPASDYAAAGQYASGGPDAQSGQSPPGGQYVWSPPEDGTGEHYVQGDWPRVWHGEYRPAGHPQDTVVLGDFGRFGAGAPASGQPQAGGLGEFDRIGQDVSAMLDPGQAEGGPSGPPWYRSPGRLALAGGGLALVALAGFLVVPAILSHLGFTGSGPSSALCPNCQFPIPSSSPAPATSAPTMTRPKPRSTRAPVAAAQPTAPPQNPMPTASPPQTTAGLAVSYSETAQGQGGFLAQVTVVNHNLSTVSGWQLVVALPFDSVSAVTNAQGSDEDDVLFLQPTASDSSIAPGGTLVVTITASGPTTIPEECSFNDIACQLTNARSPAPGCRPRQGAPGTVTFSKN